jgi:hypothetical protein
MHWIEVDTLRTNLRVGKEKSNGESHGHRVGSGLLTIAHFFVASRQVYSCSFVGRTGRCVFFSISQNFHEK